MYKATRPFEYIILFPAEISTRDEGEMYAFIFLDVFTDFVIMTGIEKRITHDRILKHIRLLTHNKDFLKHKDLPFTLVLPRFELMADDILTIIKPLKGKVAFNALYVSKLITPVLESLFATLAGKVDPGSVFLN